MAVMLSNRKSSRNERPQRLEERNHKRNGMIDLDSSPPRPLLTIIGRQAS
jgi:hypothetical protein